MVAVLWLSAALSVIALALAAQVRNEMERATSYSESIRAYYMAAGSIERARLWMQWGPLYRYPDGRPRYYMAPAPRMTMVYPDGVAVVEVIPESAKLNINVAKPEVLERLLLALGTPAPRAMMIAEAIVDWRSGNGAVGTGPFDAIYRTSSFLAPHASFKQLEELLLVRGMTTDLFYGHFGPNNTGEMVYYPGLRDCVTVYSTGMGKLDANSVPGPVLEAVGWPVAAVRGLEARRARLPFLNMSQLAAALPPELLGSVGLGGGHIFTLRATGTLRTPDGRPAGIKRTVSEVVRASNGEDINSTDQRPWVVLRWYDNEVSPVLPQSILMAGAGRTSASGASGGSTTTTATPGDEEEKEEPVKVYTTQAPSTTGTAAAPSAPAVTTVAGAPATTAASNPASAAASKTTTQPPKEPVTVYRVSGSGAVEAAPAEPKQP